MSLNYPKNYTYKRHQFRKCEARNYTKISEHFDNLHTDHCSTLFQKFISTITPIKGLQWKYNRQNEDLFENITKKTAACGSKQQNSVIL